MRIVDNEDFGYTKVRVERPQRKKSGEPKLGKDGRPVPDTKLRDYERVPLKDDFEREVIPHVPDAWMDRSADRVGYEINFTRYFYKYEKLRSVEEITQEILAIEPGTIGGALRQAVRTLLYLKTPSYSPAWLDVAQTVRILGRSSSPAPLSPGRSPQYRSRIAPHSSLVSVGSLE